MTQMAKGTGWRVIGKSIRGANHVRVGLPNQDAICWWSQRDEGKRAVLSVSDGHGSGECFRSQIGARLAVRAAKTISKSFLLRDLTSLDISAAKHWTEEDLPKGIVRQWVNAVADVISRKPFTRMELKDLELKKGVDARRKVVTNPTIAYGATILSVLVTEIYIVFLQLGDGDILVVSETGEVTCPLPKDERLFASETTSLCLRNAWRDFRIGFQRISNSPPALILVSTDGYGNSFVKEKDFLTVGSDILDHVRSDGIDRVNENLESWLIESSQQGSGDDITLGILYRVDLLRKAENPSAPHQKTQESCIPDDSANSDPCSGFVFGKSTE